MFWHAAHWLATLFIPKMTSKQAFLRRKFRTDSNLSLQSDIFWRQFGVQLPNPSDYDVAFSKLKKLIQDAELLTAYLLRRTCHDCSLGHPDLRYEINDKMLEAHLWTNASAPTPRPFPEHIVRYSLTKLYRTSICLINFIRNVQQ